MAKSRRQYWSSALGVLALLAILLIVLNIVLSQVLSLRVDLTRDKLYTLSPATIEILAELPSPINVKVFISEDLPAPDHDLKQKLRDTLSDFAAASHDRLSFEFIAPKTENDEHLATGFGMRKTAVSTRDASQRSIRLVYKGFSVIYGSEAETVPELRSGDNFEYLLVKSIVNLTRPQSKTVGLLDGFGGIATAPILQQSMSQVFDEVFGKRISLLRSEIDDNCQLSNSVDALIVLNIEEPLSDCALFAIDQAMSTGTSLAVLQSPSHGDYRQPDQPRFSLDSRLNELLTNFGVKLQDDLLLDRKQMLVGKQFTEDNALPVSLPALPIFTDIDRSQAITQSLSALSFPFSGTLSVDDDVIASKRSTLTKLVRSSPDSVTRQAGGDIQWDSLNTPRDNEIAGPHLVALTLISPFTPSRQNPKATDAPTATKPSNARLLVVANGEFLFANKITGYPDNFSKFGIHFFVNAIDWLVQDEALSAVRNRPEAPLLQPPDAETQSRIIRLNVIGIPLIVLALMLGLALLRRLRSRRIKAKFKQS